VGTHVLKLTHELNSSKNVGTHVLNFTHEHLSVSCSGRWLEVFIAPTNILVVAVDGAPDSPVVHRTGHCLVSGACHVSSPLWFGAVDC
jgi:hypothetical protein